MPCSPITLSIATIASVISVALLAIAFSTDNWVRISVDRNAIQSNRISDTTASAKTTNCRSSYCGNRYHGICKNATNVTSTKLGKLVQQNLTQLRSRLSQRGEAIDPELAQLDKEDNTLVFSRTKGLFRVCFPEQRPKDADLYRSPVETYCKNIDYYLSGENTNNFSENTMSWLHMGRSMIAMFIVSFFFTFIAFWTGIAGCWRRSPGNITATALLTLLSCLFSAGGMGLWHGVEYYEREKLTDPEFFKQWPEMLQRTSHYDFDWSYMIAWIGVGWALIASILFSGAAICLRNEREKEEALNMQYLMPVYPQKQQFAYGYAYPGPYYPGQQLQQPYTPYNY